MVDNNNELVNKIVDELLKKYSLQPRVLLSVSQRLIEVVPSIAQLEQVLIMTQQEHIENIKSRPKFKALTREQKRRVLDIVEGREELELTHEVRAQIEKIMREWSNKDEG